MTSTIVTVSRSRPRGKTNNPLSESPKQLGVNDVLGEDMPGSWNGGTISPYAAVAWRPCSC